MSGWQILGTLMLAAPTLLGLVAMASVMPLREVAYMIGGSIALTAIMVVGVGLLVGALP